MSDIGTTEQPLNKNTMGITPPCLSEHLLHTWSSLQDCKKNKYNTPQLSLFAHSETRLPLVTHGLSFNQANHPHGYYTQTIAK